MIGGNNVSGSNKIDIMKFVIGERKNLLYPTSFQKSFSRKSKQENENAGNQKCRIDTPLEYIM
jgi:hypothetical protein